MEGRVIWESSSARWHNSSKIRWFTDMIPLSILINKHNSIWVPSAEFGLRNASQALFKNVGSKSSILEAP